MDISGISQLIGSLGFPIAVCLLCFWYINKTTERHREELQSMSEALNNNTLALTRLLDKLDNRSEINGEE